MFRYFLMAETARRLRADPRLREAGKIHLEKSMSGRPGLRRQYDLWKKLIDGPVEELVTRWLADTAEGDMLRANPPIFCVIDDETRKRISVQISERKGQLANQP